VTAKADMEGGAPHWINGAPAVDRWGSMSTPARPRLAEQRDARQQSSNPARGATCIRRLPKSS